MASTNISGSISSRSSISGKVTSGGGTTDHNRLYNRDADDQHPISAITNLQDELDSKLDSETALPLIEEAVKYKAKGLYYDAAKELATKAYWYLTSEIDDTTKQGTKASIISGPYDLGAGGGGGGSVTTVTVTQVNWPSTVIVGGTTKITVNWTSLKDGTPTGKGTLYLSVNDTQVKVYSNQAQGDVTLDISDYITSGDNTVQVKVIDTYGTTGLTIGSISAITLELTSNFNYKLAYPLAGTTGINYTYIPYGDIEKTVYFIVDGEQYGTQVVKSTAEQQTFYIDALTHGDHSLSVYFKVTIDGEEVTSNTLNYALIYHITGDTTPIIASDFDDLEQEQYLPFNITYRVFIENKTTYNVDLLVDGSIYKQLSVNSDEQTWEYTGNTAGYTVLGIKCGTTTKSFNVHIAASTIPVEPVTQNLALALTTSGRSNSEPEEERCQWINTVTGESCTLTDFNWSSDGWLKDDDNNTVLRVTGDARVSIPYKPLAVDCKNTGKTIEIEFSTSSVNDYSATIIKCFSDKDAIGFYVTPQIALIKSMQSQLSTQYKEDEHVRVSFVIEKQTDNRIIWMYINGIASGACQYPDSDEFGQSRDPQEITIGSNDATIDIYTIRIYDNNLTSRQVVNNWIADTQVASLKATRYNRNNNYNDKDELVISKLPSELPYMIWDIDELPAYKGDKKLGDVRYVEPLNTARNFTATNTTYNVQGTSSAGYPVKNMRIKYKQNKDYPTDIFTWYDDNGDAMKTFPVTTGGIGDNYFTYKVDFASSEGANNVELTKLYNNASKSYGILTPPQQEDSDIRVGIDGYPIIAFHRDADGNDTFYSKANFNNDKENEAVYGFADGDECWETTNNTSDVAKFKVPVTADNFSEAFEIRYPATDGYSDITLLKPMSEWVYSTYTAEATDEVLDTVTILSEMPNDWTLHYYCYFEKDSDGNYTNISGDTAPEFVQNKYYSGTRFYYTNVVASEDGTYATKDVYVGFAYDSAEYRLAKFKAELAEHFNVPSTLFYYLYTLLFLMVDSRAKNAFPTYFASRSDDDGGDRWFWLPYDMDTAIGINNEGKLEFSYNLEDTDTVDGTETGAAVFNGQDSVIWNNVRTMFSGELSQMYAALRSRGLVTYDVIEDAFEAHQGQWSENIFNEDSKNKYITPLATGDNYLEMLLGSKEQQRKWWLYNRFKYIDSKFTAGDAKADYIQFRAYAQSGQEKPDVVITPYASIYATVSFANGIVGQARAKNPGEAVTIKNPFSTESAETDQETYIYSASQLKSIGDISGFYPATLKVASAVKLQELKVGDAGTEENPYVNPNLTELTLGANTLLKTLNVMNCSNLTSTPDLSGCTNIEEVYFNGTKIAGITLPNGGILKKLYLPSTLTALTIRNQPLLTDLQFTLDHSIFTKLWLENIQASNVDFFQMVESMDDGTGVRLIGITESVDTLAKVKTFYDKLDAMRGLDDQGNIMEDTGTAVITGTITINATVPYSEYIDLLERYKEVNIICEEMTYEVKFFETEDSQFGDTQVVYSSNPYAADPVTETLIPAKPKTDTQYFVYSKWDMDLTQPITKDTDIYAEYTAFDRIYTIKYNTQSELITTNPTEVSVKFTDTTAAPEILKDEKVKDLELVGWYVSYKDPGQKWYFNTEATPSSISNFKDFVTADDILSLDAYWNDPSAPTVTADRSGFNKVTFTAKDDIGLEYWGIKYSDSEDITWHSIAGYPTEYTTTASVARYSENIQIAVKDSAEQQTLSTQIYASKIEVTTGTGCNGIDFYEESIKVTTDFVLTGTSATPIANLDSHYKNGIIKYNDAEISQTESFSFNETAVYEFTVESTPKDYTVTFELNGHGEAVEPQQVTYLHLVTNPGRQFDTNMVLENWYTDQRFVTKWDFDTMQIVEDTVIYARWVEYHEPTTYTVEVPEDNYTVTVNFKQDANYGVRLCWNDKYDPDPDDGYTFEELQVSAEHTYIHAGTYYITTVRLDKTYYPGRSTAAQAIVPASILTDIYFANDILYTCSGAFLGSALKSVKLTDYMTKIAAYTFSKCTQLTNIDFGTGISQIDSMAFEGCTALAEDIVLPDTLETFGTSVFLGCSSIKHVVLPKKLKSIPQSMFQNCTALESVEIPTGLESIDNYAFQASKIDNEYVSSLTTLTNFSNSNVKILGYAAFVGCNKLTSIDLPETLTIIGESAFAFCKALTSIIIPKNVISIGERAFADSSNLSKIVCLAGDDLKLESNCFYNISNAIETLGPIDSGVDYDFQISFKTKIPDNLCYGMTMLKQVFLPSTIVELGDYAFENCKVLSSIKFTVDDFVSQLTTIGDCAFENNNLLSNIILPPNLTSIGDKAFSNCTTLDTVTIPKGVTHIGINVFNNCALTTAYFNNLSVDSESKVQTSDQGIIWFNQCPNYLILHILTTYKDNPGAVILAYGSCWNYYNYNQTLKYIADIE